jgi:hypothetical protein
MSMADTLGSHQRRDHGSRSWYGMRPFPRSWANSLFMVDEIMQQVNNDRARSVKAIADLQKQARGLALDVSIASCWRRGTGL